MLLTSVAFPLAYSVLFPDLRNLYLWTAIVPATLAFILLFMPAT